MKKCLFLSLLPLLSGGVRILKKEEGNPFTAAFRLIYLVRNDQEKPTDQMAYWINVSLTQRKSKQQHTVLSLVVSCLPIM
jgi:hypothetical protein